MAKLKGMKMNPSKSAARTADQRPGQQDNQVRNAALRKERLIHEEAQKAAGLWGELSVGVIERNGAAFVHIWKGSAQTNPFKLSAKKPKEIPKPEHEALAAWLKAGSYDGFKFSISAWNLSESEAQRIKQDVITTLANDGLRVVNPAE